VHRLTLIIIAFLSLSLYAEGISKIYKQANNMKKSE